MRLLPGSQCWWPADPLALYCQEARPHADAWVHAALCTAHKLSLQWLPQLNHGDAYGTREDRNKSFLCSPRRISLSLQIPWTYSNSLLSLISGKQQTKRLAFFRRLPRTKSSQRKRRWLIFPLRINWATSSIVGTSIATTIKATITIMMTNEPSIVIKTIKATIVLVTTIRTLRTASHMTKRMIASAITSRKEQWGHAQWPLLFVKCRHLVRKKDSILFKISFALSFLVLLLLKEQELWQSFCG